jgi:hypothetical protein
MDKDKHIEMTIRELFRVVRTDKKASYFKANKEICAFLGREKSRVTRYVSTTSRKKVTKITPESFTDTTDKPAERLRATEKIPRGFKLYMFVVWAAKATGYQGAEEFIKELESWAGMKHEEALKVWITNGRTTTMNRDTIKQWADVRWSYCRKPGHRQSQLGDQSDLFAWAATNSFKPASDKDLKEMTQAKKFGEKKTVRQDPVKESDIVQIPVTREEYEAVLARLSILELKVERMSHGHNDGKPRFVQRRTLGPLGYYPKSYIADALRSAVNENIDASLGMSQKAADKFVEYYAKWCEYQERHQMTSAHTHMLTLPYERNTGMIDSSALDPLPSKMTHTPLVHQGDIRLMCIVSGENQFSDGGTSTSYTKLYTIA